MRSHVAILCVLAAFALLSASGARAQSAFARDGFGEWLEGYDLRGQGLGNTGIGVVDPYNFTLANPASSAFAHSTVGYVGLEGSVTQLDDGNGTVSSSSGNIAGLGVFIPFSDHFGTRLALRPRSLGTYTIEGEIETGSGAEGNVRREEGARGLLEATADFSWRDKHTWAIALSAGMMGGALSDESETFFTDSGWVGSTDRRALRLHPAWTLGGGLLWHPVKQFSVGAAFSTGTRISVEEELLGPGGKKWTYETTIDPPSGAGAGGGILLTDLVRVSGDVYWRGWEDLRIGGELPPQEDFGVVRNTVRWGVGLERLSRIGPTVSAFDRMALRIGFAYIPWYALNRDGNAANEYRLTAGAGLVLKRDRGRVDLLLAYGRRGSRESTGIEEDYFRLGFAATFARVLREY